MGPGGAGDEEDQSLTLKLPLLSKAATMSFMHSPERPAGIMRTPPHHTSASVPFRWEEEPGKPKPCTTLITLLPDSSSTTTPHNKCLELPPRLLLVDHATSNKITKLSSPTTVLEEGPYYVCKSSRFHHQAAPSFRMMSSECYGSFRKSFSPEEADDERDHHHDHHHPFGGGGALVVLCDRESNTVQKQKGVFFGSWRKKKKGLKGNKRDVGGGGSYVFPSSVDRYSEGGSSSSREDEGNISNCSTNDDDIRITRSGSFTSVSLARPRFWATIFVGLKQAVVPWKCRKAKEDGLLR